ncbi:class A beta-lactamase [Pseudonocardia sp. CA-107938]|uniref:class A beta-lactamase n=1 Tax=Pseudonocardia sp. CA-107938 TaxID=3240021 RepID=UPI003D8D9C99
MAGVDRRALLTAALTAPVACAAPRPAAPVIDVSAQLAALEQRFATRLGVHAVATGDDRELGHRADERFPHCSTFKVLAAGAVLDRYPIEHLEQRVPIAASDVVSHSPISGRRVGTGMTIREAADAAIRYSDNTAGNLLLKQVDGPAGVTAFVRSLGDGVTRLDRWETELNSAIPGDERDTSTPRALASDYRELVLGTRLDAAKRALLRGWLVANTTGDQRIRAGVPQGWQVGDKTGTGDHAAANDVAVLWPPNAPPLVLAVLSASDRSAAKPDNALFGEVARIVTSALGPASGGG